MLHNESHALDEALLREEPALVDGHFGLAFTGPVLTTRGLYGLKP